MPIRLERMRPRVQTGHAIRRVAPRPRQARRVRSSSSGRIGLDLALLHRSPDLRLGAVDRHHPGRRRSRCSTLPLALYPAGLAAERVGQLHLPRRRCPGRSPSRWRARSSSRSTASRTCSTCRRTCTNDGAYSLTITFKHGVDLNLAQVLVQNRVSLALPQLPDVIKQTGVTTRKRSPDILMSVALDLARRPLRSALPEQLRLDARQGRARPRAGRRRHLDVRPAATTACGSGSTPRSWRRGT